MEATVSKQDYTAEYGPGWVDVEKAIDHVEGTFGVKVTSRIERHRKKGNEWFTLVSVECRVVDQWPHGIVRCSKIVRWDRREFKTITAVLFNSILHCDNWLTKAQEDAERQATLL